MSAAKKKKKKKWGWLITLIIILAACQYISAHVSGWIITSGKYDLMDIGGLMDYFATNPLDFTSVNLGAYAIIYGAGFAMYFHILFSRQPPKAEMKGIEHGSNALMTHEEIMEFSQERTTPDFPYSRDVTVPGCYKK